MSQLDILRSDLQHLRDKWKDVWKEIDKDRSHPLYFKWRSDKSRGIQLSTLIKQIEVGYKPNEEATVEVVKKLF